MITYSVCIYTKDSNFSDKFNELDLNTVFNEDRDTIKFMYVMDMVIAAVMLVVSICLILISMIILRFTIHFTMSEEFREIGVMKAIGITTSKIRGLYLIKYFVISMLVYCTIHISPNDLPEFPSAVLASIDDATASPRSAALQSENSFCVVWLKMNGTVH